MMEVGCLVIGEWIQDSLRMWVRVYMGSPLGKIMHTDGGLEIW